MTDQHDTVTAPLQTPGAGPQMRMIEVALIEESLTNPRKHFDQVKLKELANSIAASGVHQPILVRPLPGSRVPDTFGFRRKGQPLPAYELVAGARRLRACRMANVLEIPAVIRELTDDQAMEVAIIENLQRDDLTELEEAEGYEHLMKHNGMTAEEVGAKIGKSRSYVYGRLKLVDGCFEVRTALREGQIDASKALLLARIPDHALQIKALEEITDDDWRGETMSYRAAADYIQREYMLRLDTARFKITDATLVPKAGACKDCTKRTGHEPDLFADVKSADVCTDPKCFRAKEEAHSEAVVAMAKSKGQTVITGKEAIELISDGYNNTKLKGYRRLDVVEDSPTDQPLRKIIGAQMKADGIEPVMIENPKKMGELIAALPNDVVLRLLKLVEGQAQATKEVAKEVRQFADDKKAKTAAKAQDQFEQDWRTQLMRRSWDALHTYTLTPFTIDVHRYLVVRAANNLSTDDAQAIAKLLDLGKVGAHSAVIDFAKSTPDPDFLNLLIIMQRDSSIHDHTYGGRIANEGLHLVAGNVFKDLLPGVIEEVKAESRARFFPKAQKPATAHQLAAQPQEGAGGDGGGGKAKGGDKKTARPAAQRPVRKTTAEEAQQGIAAAMQGLGEEGTPGAAVAAQGNDGHPVAVAQGAAAPAGGAGADVCAAPPAVAVLASGVRVKVLATASGPKQKPMIGKIGTISGKVGPQAWDVCFTGKRGTLAKFIGFDATELEVQE